MRRILMAAGLVLAARPAAGQAKSESRDSAGARIVTSSAPRSDRPLYRVDPTPVVDLGAGSGEDELVQPILTARLRDGRIVVATGGTELRFFSPAGKRLATFGRKGSGPSEFQRVTWLGVADGDTVMAFDAGTSRLTLVTPGAALARSVSFANGRRRLAGVFPGQTLLVSSAGGLARPESGPFRDTLLYLVAGRAGDSLGTVGRFPGREMLIEVRTANKLITSVNMTGLPFGREGFVGVADSGVVVAPADRYELFRYDRSGRLRTVIRRIFRPEPPTPADVDRLVTVQTAGLPAGQEAAARSRVKESYAKAPLPKSKPPYDEVRPRGGELWVRDYHRLDHREQPGRWSVFDASGQWATTVETPPGFDLQVAGADFLLGVWLDSDDVPHVRLLRLTAAR